MFVVTNHAFDPTILEFDSSLNAYKFIINLGGYEILQCSVGYILLYSRDPSNVVAFDPAWVKILMRGVGAAERRIKAAGFAILETEDEEEANKEYERLLKIDWNDYKEMDAS